MRLVTDTTYLGIPFGASITLDDVFRKPISKARTTLAVLKPILTRLPLHQKISAVNMYVISLFTYVCLFFVIPTELWKMVKEMVRRSITPHGGGAYPYSALVCAGFIMGVKPGLRDIWAAGVSLLAPRARCFSPTPDWEAVGNYDLHNCMTIVKHRTAACVEYWNYLENSSNAARTRAQKSTRSSRGGTSLTMQWTNGIQNYRNTFHPTPPSRPLCRT